jgi:hypothetical protein
MSQQDKSAYYQALKTAGIQFAKHYREYSEEELKIAYDQLRAGNPDLPEHPNPPASNNGATAAPAAPSPAARRAVPRPQPTAPVRPRDPNEMAGQRLNERTDDREPLRTDPETGFIWYQEEVRKPAVPKPRGRRVLRYLERGVKKATVKDGEYTETFEISGDRAPVEQEVKITLPSYQVGIYKDPRLPFKVYVYDNKTGFDLFEVENYFGGAELVPEEVKRTYVSNALCYDVRSTIRWIQAEYRRLQLAGKV